MFKVTTFNQFLEGERYEVRGDLAGLGLPSGTQSAYILLQKVTPKTATYRLFWRDEDGNLDGWDNPATKRIRWAKKPDGSGYTDCITLVGRGCQVYPEWRVTNE